MKTNEIRKRYLEFFKKKKHAVIPSASLIPSDPTTLFVGSGMQPLIPYLLGERHAQGKRLTNSQKCFRAEDIEEVGDNRHTTFFEMLGNWSLGDYFKEKQLSWFFEFLTKELKIKPERLYVTVFWGDKKNNIPRDEESVEIWKKLFKEKNIIAKEVELINEKKGGDLGMQGGRIFYYDSSKNWWSRSGTPENMPFGEPGGPDSEVFYEFEQVEHDTRFGKHCHPNCDCGRFLEIGNSVFMEYRKKEDGTFKKLAQKNVDFGGGLERITAAYNNKADVFNIDVFRAIFDGMKKSYDLDYDIVDNKVKSRMRIIADHLRAVVFMMSDGVLPSNKGRGYIMRRLLRRAIFNIYKIAPLGFSHLYPLTNIVVDLYQDIYPNLKENRHTIHEEFEKEEVKFMFALKKGVKEAEKWLESKRTSGIAVDAEGTFRIYDTHSVPVEMTIDMIKEYGLKKEKNFDIKLKRAFEKHQEVSRAGVKKKFGGLGKEASYEAVKLHTATHLLHQALRDVLGKHVRQMGSDITHERLRFDFSHPEKLAQEQIKRIEDLVNEKIKENLEVKKEEMSYEQALKSGALAFFREKYPEKVFVYSIKGFSKEICAGPHVERTGELGKFRIVKEKSASAGVRRIRAVLEK